MLVDRKILEVDISKLLNNLVLNKDEMLEKISEQLAERNCNKGYINSILYCMQPIEVLSDEALYWLVDAIEESSKGSAEIHSKFTISKYFTSKEIQKWSHSKKDISSTEVYPVIINNVMQINEDQWQCVMSVKKIKELYLNQLISYNFNTQRDLTKVVREGKTLYKITVFQKKIKQISEQLLNGQFIPNYLTLNISLDNPENKVDIRTNEIVLESGNFDILDGYHRLRGIMKALEVNPDLEINFSVLITMFSEEKAMKFVIQEDKQTPMKPLSSKAAEASNFTKMIVDRLNQSSKNIYFNQITKYNQIGLEYNLFVHAIDLAYSNVNDLFGVNDAVKNLTEAINEFSKYGIQFDDFSSVLLVFVSTLKFNDIILEKVIHHNQCPVTITPRTKLSSNKANLILRYLEGKND